MPILLLPRSSAIVAPVVVTNPVTIIGLRGATASGSIIGGGAITGRGIQYGTTPVLDKSIDEVGAFLTPSTFTEAITNLYPGITYYVRAYATNSAGTTFGAWQSFATTASPYKITINGVDRTADVINRQTTIVDNVTVQQNTMSFQLIDRQGLGVPQTDKEIIVTLEDGTILFGGYIVKVQRQTVKGSYVLYQVDCMDYVRLLDRNLVSKTYLNMTDAAIIADIVSTYCPGFGITTNNVVSGVTIDQISFNYVQPSQAFRKIADLTGRNWYIDYSKDVHYFPLTQSAAPFNITDTLGVSLAGNYYSNFQLKSDATQLKNRVYVRGGTQLSSATTYSRKGDGTTIKFNLPDKPHSVTVTVNGVAKTLGIKNINTSGYDFYLNFEEKYIEQDSGGVVLGTSDVLQVSYTYDIPILVAVEDSVSIAANGVHEFPIFDSSISTTVAARARASAELTDYSNNLIEAQFDTFTSGFRSGQYININSAIIGITNTNYYIQKVEARNLGGGQYIYTVYLASAKTMGIIRFLIELLEQANNTVKVSSNEVLDNLLTLSDSLDPNSLTDSLIIDSMGAYATWCTDSLQSTPVTRMRWNLFQWK